MPYTNLVSLGPSGIFTGITENKGEMLVCDGNSNVKLPVGTDGYVLTSNSSAPLGVEWAVGGSGGPMSQPESLYYTNTIFQTTPTSGIGVPLFSVPAFTGMNLILVNFEARSRNLIPSNNNFYVVVYKDGVLEPNSLVTFSALPGVLSSYTFSYSGMYSGGEDLKVYIYSTTLSLLSPRSSILLLKISSLISTKLNSVFRTNGGPVEVLSMTVQPGKYVVLVVGTAQSRRITDAIFTTGVLSQTITLLPSISSSVVMIDSFMTMSAATISVNVQVSSSIDINNMELLAFAVM